jgi:hypothetical protein
MRIVVRSAVAAFVLTGLTMAALAAAPANALPIPGPSTNADITCNSGTPTGPLRGGITTAAWGSGYPGSTKITVQEVVTLNGSTWSGKKSDLVTSPSGAWNVPTTKDTSATGSGLYEYRVTVTDPEGKLTYGSAYDSCKTG